MGVLLVFVAGPGTNEEEIVPFRPEMELVRRYAEELDSTCGEGARIWRAEEGSRGVDIASRKRPSRKTKCKVSWSLVPSIVLYVGMSIVFYKDTYHTILREHLR